MNKKFKLLTPMRTKSGKSIPAGVMVDVKFDVKTKSGDVFHSGFSVNWNGVRICSARPARLGIKTPSEKTLEKWSNDSVCKSVFGHTVEHDGWDHEGSPSWLLFLGLI